MGLLKLAADFTSRLAGGVNISRQAYSSLVDAANYRERARRPFEPNTVNSLPQEINLTDWYQLLSDSRKLYWNLGPARGAVNDKAVYAVGRSWSAKFTGADKEWGKLAESWVNEEWYPVADVRGGMFDFKTDLCLSSISIDRDGEVYILLTESADGWPQIQVIPAHMIGQRDMREEVVESGPYRGLQIMQGIICNKFGRAVAYRVLGASPDEDEDISATNLVQLFDPDSADQLRGLPCFTHAILDLKDLRQVQGYEKIAAQIMASIGLIESNETGAPDMGDAMQVLRRTPAQSPTDSGPQISQDIHGVTMRYFRANSGSKIEQLKSDRPGAAVTDFMDRLIRNACTGAGWPYELAWDASKLGGANVRLLIARAMRSVEDRQDLLRPVARRCVGYAVAKAIKHGRLSPNPEWYKWKFTLPARITTDYGRDAQADREDYKAGMKTLTGILAEQGVDFDEFMDEKRMEDEKMGKAGVGQPEDDGDEGADGADGAAQA